MIIIASALHARLDPTMYANVGLYGPVFVESVLLFRSLCLLSLPAALAEAPLHTR